MRESPRPPALTLASDCAIICVNKEKGVLEMVGVRNIYACAAVVAAVVCAYTADAATWNGRREMSTDYSSGGNAVDIAYPNSDAVIWQTNGWIAITNAGNDNVFGYNCWTDNGTIGVYLLDGGKLTIYKNWLAWGGYNQGRQAGGDFCITGLSLRQSPIPKDFVFGGSGTADLGWYGGGVDPEVGTYATFAFLDDISFVQSHDTGLINTLGNGTHRIWAYNGGRAEYRLGTNQPVGDFFAYNGGMRAFMIKANTSNQDLGRTNVVTGTIDAFGNNPQVRLYENGGGVEVVSGNFNMDGFDIKVPTGAIKSRTLTDAARNNNGEGWDYPPAVEIYDEGGIGTNAAAIVDYDFVNRAITNITVLSGGENYTNPKAQFRYRSGVENRLLGTPLECETYNPVGGDFTISTTNRGTVVTIMNHTNYLHGALIVDMDKSGVADGGKNLSLVGNTLVIKYVGNNWPKPRFPNCTKLVVKSGCVNSWRSFGFNHDATVNFFPKCFDLELYGGHISGGTAAFSNVVVGGTAWLTGHATNQVWLLDPSYQNFLPYAADLNITQTPDGINLYQQQWGTPPLPGRMVVDVDSTPDDEPARLRGGTMGRTATDSGNMCIGGGSVRFGGSPSNPCTMTIKNYESLRRFPRRRVLLDISDPNLVVAGTNNVNAVTPPDVADLGRLRWSAIDRKLYWEPYRGMILLFR